MRKLDLDSREAIFLASSSTLDLPQFKQELQMRVTKPAYGMIARKLAGTLEPLGTSSESPTGNSFLIYAVYGESSYERELRKLSSL